MNLFTRCYLLAIAFASLTVAGHAQASPAIVILKAIYGAGAQTADVGPIVSRFVAAGKFVIDVSNDALGGDPAPNVSKQLVVEYTLNGISKKATVPEEDTLNLLTGAIAGVVSQVVPELPVSPEALAAVKPRLVATRYASDDYVVASAVVTQAPFGAKPDGVTDCTSAVQTAIDAVTRAGGGVVYLPAGRYRFEGRLVLRAGLTLRGDWKEPNTNTGDVQGAGTILEPTEGRGKPDGAPFITVDGSTCVRNLSIWYPDQTIDDVAPYPWTIATDNRHGDNNYTVKNVTFVNCYSALRLGGNMGIGPTLVQNIYGTALSTGVFLDGAADTPHMALLHFGPQYWLGSGLGQRPDAGKLKKYLLANATALDLGRADGLDVYRAAFDGYSIGVLSRKTKLGTPYGGFFGLNATHCNVGLSIEDIRTGWQFTCCTFEGRTAAIWAKEGFHGQLQVNGCRLIAPGADALRSDGVGNVQLQNTSIDGRVIMTKQGVITMLACTLSGKASRVVIGPHVLRALILGSTTKAFVDNSSLGDVQVDPRPLASVVPSMPPAAWVPDRRPSTSRFFDVANFGASSAGLAEPLSYNPKTYNAGDADLRSKYVDNTSAFQKALDRAGAAGGGTVYVRAGIYYFKGCLKVPAGVELRGCADGPHPAHTRGTYLLPTSGRGHEEGTPFITLAPNSGARGFTVVYPDQKIDTIVAYPWTFRAMGPKCWLMDVTVPNPYRLADFGSYPSTGHLLRAVQGSPLRCGLWVSKGSGEMDTCDFNPGFWLFLYKSAPAVCSTPGVAFKEASQPLCDYINLHQEPYVFGSCPQTLQINNGVCPCGTGLRFVSDGGQASGGWVINHESDGSTQPLRIDASSPAGLDINNTVLAVISPGKLKSALQVSDSARGSVRLFNGMIWGQPVDVALDLGGHGQTTLQSWHMDQLVKASNVSGGSVTLQGMECGSALTNVAESGQVKRLELDGNLSMGDEFTYPASAIARGNSKALTPTPLTQRLHIGFDGDVVPLKKVMDVGVSECDDQISPGCGHSGKNGLLITATPTPGAAHSASMYVIGDSLSVPILPTTVFRYWLRPESMTGRKVALDLEFTDGGSYELMNVDSYGRLLHPNAPRGVVGQWTMVEAQIGSAAGKTLKRICVIFDDYDKNPIACRAVVDDIAIGEPIKAVDK